MRHDPERRGTVKSEAIRVTPPASLQEARAVVARFVEHYNGVRLHSAIGYITPNDLLAGRRDEIHAARDAKLETCQGASTATSHCSPRCLTSTSPGARSPRRTLVECGESTPTLRAASTVASSPGAVVDLTIAQNVT